MSLHGPPTVPDEQARAEAVRALDLVGRPQEERFARIARLAAGAMDAPLAYVTLVGSEDWWAVACIGAEGRRMPRDQAMCTYAITAPEPFVVPDMREDARFRDNPLVTGSDALVAYIGVPIAGPTGHRVGTLCVLDRRPRVPSAADLATLTDLAALVETELSVASLARALEGRRLAERRLRAVLEAAAEGVLVLDGSGTVTDANPAAGALLGRPREAVLGRPIVELARPDGEAGDDEAVRSLLRHRDEASGTASFARADGTTLHAAFRAAPLEPLGSGLVVTFHDVAEREALEVAREAFVATTSHALRTPLTSVAGFTQLLAERTDLPADAAAHAAAAARGAKRLAALAEELLQDVAGRAAGGVAAEPVDLVAIARDLAAEVGPEAPSVEVQGPGLEVRGDAVRLATAIGNLLANAVKFTPRDGTVRVVGRHDGEDVVLEVHDEGPGVPAAEVPLLGRRFFRASTATGVPGTGLGLADAREIAEQHGGRLVVASRLGEGSTFALRLPAGPTGLT